jgi:hypothetical protein
MIRASAPSQHSELATHDGDQHFGHLSDGAVLHGINRRIDLFRLGLEFGFTRGGQP